MPLRYIARVGMVQLNIVSSALSAEVLLDGNSEAQTLQFLGPIIDGKTLTNIELTFAQATRGIIYVAGFLLRPAYEIIKSRFQRQGDLNLLQEYLRPIACSLTELRLEPQHLERLPESPELQDQVIRRYVENVTWDLRTYVREELPHCQLLVQGLYYSLTREGLILCHPRERCLTPPFGRLSLVPRSGLKPPRN